GRFGFGGAPRGRHPRDHVCAGSRLGSRAARAWTRTCSSLRERVRGGGRGHLRRNIRVVSKPSRDIWLLPHELKFRTRFNTGPRGVRCGEPGGCSAGGGRRRAAARRRRRGRPRPWRSRTRTWSSTFSAERTAAAASARAALLEAGVLIRASEAPGGRDHLCGSAQSAALSGPASSPPVAPGLLLLIRALRPLICICLNYTHCITLPSHFSMF
ncbi:unnamed protein product, partial [Prorocentrum cordatum]